MKYLPWINLQTACNVYFWLIGSAAVVGALGPPLRRAVSPCGINHQASLNGTAGWLHCTQYIAGTTEGGRCSKIWDDPPRKLRKSKQS